MNRGKLHQVRDSYRFRDGKEAGMAAREILMSVASTPSTEAKMPEYTYEPLMELYNDVQASSWAELGKEDYILARVILQSLWATPSMQDKLPKYVYEPLMMLQDYVEKHNWNKVEGI